jgi:hypothetical protein
MRVCVGANVCGSEKKRIGLEKLNAAFIDDVAVEHIQLSAFRAPYFVQSFRTKKLTTKQRERIDAVHRSRPRPRARALLLLDAWPRLGVWGVCRGKTSSPDLVSFPRKVTWSRGSFVDEI